MTQIVAATEFYPATRTYHEKNPVRYRYYRWGSGPDRRLHELWGGAAPAGPATPGATNAGP